jgi:MoaA/NifB/PqqE/SkfB family radical SAM enzyme
MHYKSKFQVILNSLRNSIPLPAKYRKKKLTHITWELTNLSNSKCDMCHIWANKKNDGELTLNEIETIFSDPEMKYLQSIIFTGGEVFIRDDIFQIIQIVNRHIPNIHIALSTNGLLPEKVIQVAKKCIENNFDISVGISLDGIGSDHDSRRRVDGNFYKVDQILIPALRELKYKNNKPIFVGIGHCLDPKGTGSLEKVMNYCKDRGLKLLTQIVEDFVFYKPRVKRTQHKIHPVIHLKEYKTGFSGENTITHDKHSYSHEEIEKLKGIIRQETTVHHERVISFLEGRPPAYQCSTLRNFIFLKYDGEVTPCFRFADIELGNLKNESIKNILKKDETLKVTDSLMKCDGCYNTWCTDWSMEENAFPFYREILKRFRILK